MRDSNKVFIVNPKGQGLKHFYITSSFWSLGGRMPFIVLCPCLLYSEQLQNNKQHYRLVDCHASRRLSVLLVRRYLSHFLHYQYLVFNCSANMSPPNFHSDCIADYPPEDCYDQWAFAQTFWAVMWYAATLLIYVVSLSVLYKHHHSLIYTNFIYGAEIWLQSIDIIASSNSSYHPSHKPCHSVTVIVKK